MPKEETDTVKLKKSELKELLDSMIPLKMACDPDMVKEHSAILSALPGWMEKVDGLLGSNEEKLDKLAIAMAQNRDEYMERSSTNTQEIKILQAERKATKSNISMVMVAFGVLCTAIGLVYQIYASNSQINKIERELAKSRNVTSRYVTNPMHNEPLWRNRTNEQD